MTPRIALGSRVSAVLSRFGAALIISLGCTSASEAQPAGIASPAGSTPAPITRELSLGVVDTGIFSDLDPKVQVALPANLAASTVTAALHPTRAMLVVEVEGFPVKAYPTSAGTPLIVGDHRVPMRAGDRAELVSLLAPDRIAVRAASRDRDRDGIPDPLDVLIGAKKTVLNADAYTEGYVTIKYPMGDVPRTMGVCTDVVIRALRNAGIDLQQAVHEDIRRARKAYPMVRGNGNPNIDHRRVATLLPYFKRHWQARNAKLDERGDPLRPGDVVFMDTFPARPGPDHIGIVSDQIGPSGLPLIINNWTNGTVTAEMDLLTFVPVTHRFRAP
ncbi:MAG: DUF1287 domain-containing protein [Kofleriaceae bacterium]